MLFDIERREAKPGKTSKCPCCKTDVIAKCGDIMVWHWAHVTNKDCDPWYEPMSIWHLNWQALVPKDNREVVIERHRADIKLNSGKVVEIQRSPISNKQVASREEFYGKMAWIFDVSGIADNFIIKNKISKSGNEYVSFRWKRPRKAILGCESEIYFDFGDEVLCVNQDYETGDNFRSYEAEYEGRTYNKWYGWGHLLPKSEQLFRRIFGNEYNGGKFGEAEEKLWKKSLSALG